MPAMARLRTRRVALRLYMIVVVVVLWILLRAFGGLCFE